VGSSIRIFSGNLWFGRADPDGLVELIRRHRIDVFAAQELGFANAEAISSELPFGRLEPCDHFMGMGIALRRPARTERIPLPFRDARRALLDPGEWADLEQAVCLVNVHFQAPHSLRPFPSALLRHRQVRALERFMYQNPSASRCVMGDYNATPAWPLYRRMRRHLDDAALHFARREGRPVHPTWGPRPDSRRLLRIDHAMVRGLDVEHFEVVAIPGSDHSGILLDCLPRLADRLPDPGR
jgi:endonuclease/exonuclease/phosphatase (EEP) superfamily protein YafD